MEIRLEKALGKWLIYIGDVIYDTQSFADKYNFQRTTLTQGMSSRKDATVYVENIVWKYNNNVPYGETIFINNDGERCATTIVERHVPGLRKTYIRKRLSLWKQGRIDGDSLFQPEEYGKCGGSNSPGPSTSAITTTEVAEARQKAAKKMLVGMQPRKETWEIQQSGIWEKEHKDKSLNVRPHKCLPASSTHGSWYFGD